VRDCPTTVPLLPKDEGQNIEPYFVEIPIWECDGVVPKNIVQIVNNPLSLYLEKRLHIDQEAEDCPSQTKAIVRRDFVAARAERRKKAVRLEEVPP
jgi:hypothetical protein